MFRSCVRDSQFISDPGDPHGERTDRDPLNRADGWHLSSTTAAWIRCPNFVHSALTRIGFISLTVRAVAARESAKNLALMAGQEKASSDVFALIARDLQVFRHHSMNQEFQHDPAFPPRGEGTPCREIPGGSGPGSSVSKLRETNAT